MSNQFDAAQYAEQLGTQMRKGLLVYCVLVICSKGGPYNTSEIIRTLQGTSLDVVGGTIYPLLNRLCKDGLLLHEWRESSQGPPRKYYRMSEQGHGAIDQLRRITGQLQKTINDIERE